MFRPLISFRSTRFRSSLDVGGFDTIADTRWAWAVRGPARGGGRFTMIFNNDVVGLISGHVDRRRGSRVRCRPTTLDAALEDRLSWVNLGDEILDVDAGRRPL